MPWHRPFPFKSSPYYHTVSAVLCTASRYFSDLEGKISLAKSKRGMTPGEPLQNWTGWGIANWSAIVGGREPFQIRRSKRTESDWSMAKMSSFCFCRLLTTYTALRSIYKMPAVPLEAPRLPPSPVNFSLFVCLLIVIDVTVCSLLDQIEVFFVYLLSCFIFFQIVRTTSSIFWWTLSICSSSGAAFVF
jgi:hypothetical protein